MAQTEISNRKKNRIIDFFIAGYPSIQITSMIDVSEARISKILSAYIKKVDYEEISKIKQIGLIEKLMFRQIDIAELTKDPDDIKKRDTLISTYVKFKAI